MPNMGRLPDQNGRERINQGANSSDMKGGASIQRQKGRVDYLIKRWRRQAGIKNRGQPEHVELDR